MNTKQSIKSIYLYIFFILIPISYILGNGVINSLMVLSILLTSIFLFNKNYFLDEKKIIISFFLFFIYLQINSFFINSENSNLLSSVSYIRFFLFSLVILFLLKMELIPLKNISIIFITITLFVSIDILYQYIFYKNLFGLTPGICSYPEGVPLCERFSGVFGDELIGGSFLANFGIFSLIFYLYSAKLNKKQILFSSISGLIVTLAIIISGERGALLTIVYCLIIYTIFNKDLRNSLLKIILFFSLVFIASINFSENAKHRFIDWPYNYLNSFPGDNLFTKYLHTSWGGHYITAYTIFSDNVIFGTGIRSFRVVCKSLDKELISKKHNIDVSVQPKDLCNTHPHNMQIELLSDLGILGFILIHTILYYVLFDKYINKKSLSQRNKNISLFLLILITANFIPLRPTGSFFSTLPGYNIWFLVGFYLYFVNKKGLNEKI